MDILDTAQLSISSLKAHRLRTLLAILGIIIGVGSVVLMVSLGRSLETYVLDQISSLGGNLIEIYPSGFEKFGRPTDTLTLDDYNGVRRLSTVEHVAPVLIVQDPVIYGSEKESPFILGSTKDIFGHYGLTVSEGRLLTESDEKSGRPVAVLGAATAKELFPFKNPLGKKVKIGNKAFTVVGVLKSVGSLILEDLDAPVYIPFSVAKSLTGQRHLSYILLKARSDSELAQADITSFLRQSHSIENPDNDPDKDDFMVRSAAQATEIVGSVTLGLTIFLGLVAGISLIVGGIGIMNIMLVSAAERRTEIGLRKAVGARKKDISIQFLLEAVTLTSVGGSIGIVGATVLGIILSLIASHYVGELRFAISWPALGIAVCMAVSVGIIFGLYPAIKASALEPVDAMRPE